MPSRELQVAVERTGGVTEIRLAGTIDEHAAAALQRGFSNPVGTIRLNLRDVQRINSFGIGILMRHLGAVSAQHKVEFGECSDVIVDQFQMLDFSRYGRITSFFARYLCQRCEAQESFLLVIGRDLQVDKRSGSVRAPEFPCSCSGSFAVDDSLEFVIEHLD